MYMYQNPAPSLHFERTCTCMFSQVPGCYRSGLMQSFSKHLIKRLNITQEIPEVKLNK